MANTLSGHIWYEDNLKGRYMENIYRIFTWFITGIAWLLLLTFLIPLFFKLPFLFPLVYGGLLYYSWRAKIKKDILTEPVCHSKKQSALLWGGILLITFSVLRLIAFVCCESNYIFGIKLDYFFIPMFFIAAGITIFKPFKKHQKGTEFGITGEIIGVLLFLFSMINNVSNYGYKGEKLPVFYEMPSGMQEKFFPEGAYNFDIKGKSAMFANYAEWSCNVSEKDFEIFRKKHRYNFVLNRTNVNEDSNVAPLAYSDDDWQKPYYFYNNRHANGGGVTMRYSVPEQKLYGSFSNR